jgi:hypothetical protein
MTPDERRTQIVEIATAVASLAKVREIKAKHVSDVKDDLENRPVLETLIRRWTQIHRHDIRFVSDGVQADSSTTPDIEHMVPVRVIVDRMIMAPTECRTLLNEAIVLAHVTKAEHQQLGGIFDPHAAIYQAMLDSPIPGLEALARKRYEDSGVHEASRLDL